ncbi:hypothetical protein J4413_03330 [Candidatus Woesearchaeota archaeon]|nr:hypothetical protein [Candidatus Woesearchaeota archaeon]
METVTIPKVQFDRMKGQIELFSNTKLYQRLLQFEQNISKKKYTRKDLGF